MTALRQRMQEDLRIRNYSARTVSTYIRCVEALAEHFSKSPAKLGPEEIREYQRHLVDVKQASASTLNQVSAALRFLYTTSLRRKLPPELIPYAKRPKKLPVVLSRGEAPTRCATASRPTCVYLHVTVDGRRTTDGGGDLLARAGFSAAR